MLNLKYKDIIEKKLYHQIQNTVPKDLKHHIESLDKVLRFQLDEYPENVILDSTKAHTLKCVYLAENANFNLSKDKLIRILWIHDIPELITQDITVIEKDRNPTKATEFENSENHAAKELLSRKDQELLELFNRAQSILKGEDTWKENKIPEEAFIAKLIDNAEGNMTFHYFISKWVASNAYKKDHLPPMDSFLYTFVTNKKYAKLIKKNFPSNHQEKLLELISLTFNNIKDFWKEVPENRIPKKVNLHLKELD